MCARGARLLASSLALLLLCATVTSIAAETEAERALERRVKAAFLYRFTEFINWPEGSFPRADSPFIIVVVGRDPIAAELRQITTGRTIAGRPIEVRRVDPDMAMAPAHIVFIPDPDSAHLSQVIRAAPRNALIVTDFDGALARGSVINFVIVEGRVRFEISLESAEKRGLRLSSRLLAVAQSVRGIP